MQGSLSKIVNRDTSKDIINENKDSAYNQFVSQDIEEVKE
jgi:hypothetical protein